MENQKLESCMHMFYETRDDMEQSLKTIKNVMEQQDELANIIVHAKNKKHNFDDFIKDTKDGVVGFKNQLEVVNEKLVYVKSVIDTYEAGHKEGATENEKLAANLVEQVVTTVCLAMGIAPTNTELKIQEEQRKAEQEKLAKEKAEAARNVLNK